MPSGIYQNLSRFEVAGEQRISRHLSAESRNRLGNPASRLCVLHDKEKDIK